MGGCLQCAGCCGIVEYCKQELPRQITKQYNMSKVRPCLLIWLVYACIWLKEGLCAPVWKTGNSTNLNIQTGEVVLFSSSLPINVISYFTITFPIIMSTDVLQGGVGVVGLNAIIERQQGWTLYVDQVNSTTMSVQAYNNYNPSTPSMMVSLLQVRYIVSCHPLLDINFAQVNFTNQNVTNVFMYDQGCQFIRCRKSTATVTYKSKSTSASIAGIVSVAGYSIFNILNNTEYNNGYIFVNYTTQTYFGVNLGLSSFGTSSCTVTVTVYGFTQLNQVSMYHITYESGLTNTYKSRDVSGYGSVGCYYDIGGCYLPLKIQVWSNTTFSTATTSLSTYYDNMYFFGLNSFIYYSSINDADFTANPYISPSITMNFQTTSSTVNSGNGQYSTTISFSANPSNLFTFKFAYLIDINFDCPTSGPIYHISSTQCDSVCPTSFYANTSTMYCLACNSRCYTCAGPSAVECLSCYTSSQNRVLNGTICECKSVGYYDNGISDSCQLCSVTCLTCNFSSSSSCLTCNSSDYRTFDNAGSCPCNTGYYHGGGTTCLKCSYSCVTCSGGAANNCLTCPSLATSFRNMSSGSCSCINGYFNSGTNVTCLPCLYSCATCSNSTSCTGCSSANKRTFNNVSNTCPCNNGFYDNGFSSLCLACFSTCATCNGPAFTDCFSCLAVGVQNRAWTSTTNTCDCVTGYFDYNFVCYACHVSCLNCTNSTANTCLSCKAALFRTFDPATNRCVCNDGYFDTGSTTNGTCALCDPTCLTCNTVATNCTSCSPTANRVQLSTSCPCKDGYVDVSGTCTVCHYSCLTCNGLLATQCLSCNTTYRYVLNTSCLCSPSLYDDGMNLNCVSCHVQCLTCSSNSNSSCLTCSAAMMRWIPALTPNYCYCMTHYYDSGPAACSPCASKCENCTLISTHCLSCYSSQNRQLTSFSTCTCISHYYDTGGDNCLPCAPSCSQCVGLSTNCTSCPVLRFLVNGSCSCIGNYYQDSVTGNCLTCSLLCLLCTNSSTTCTQCYSNMNRQLSNTQCVCQYGYYDNGLSPICQPCPYYCVNCSSLSTCLSCDSSSHRTLITGICKCTSGYYDNGLSVLCLTCSPLCVTCSDYAVCTSCNSALHRAPIANNCQCVGTYYDNYTISNNIVSCQPCHFSCATCSGPFNTSCISCGTNRNFTSYSCPCNQGYYEASQVCYLCDLNCRTCNTLATNCTSCYSGLPLLNNTCLCYSGQYYSGGSCYPCDPYCQECEGVSTYCTKCYASQLTFLLGSSCVCQNGTYQNSTALTCILCHLTCLTCIGPQSNNCSQCDSLSPVFRTLSAANECVCLPTYFLNVTTLSCQPCNSVCTGCTGPSEYNCTSCISNYTLVGSFCQSNVQCLNYLYQGQCLNVCPQTSYPTSTHTCLKCTNGCLYCLSATKCLQCLPGYFFNSSTSACQPICQNGMYVDANGNCLPCMSNCAQCQYNPAKTTVVCIKCANTYYLKDQTTCSQVCPVPYYVPIGSLCLKCIGNCLTCNSLSVSDCVLCEPNTAFLTGRCFDVCPIGYFWQQNSPAQPTCEPCLAACASCQHNQCLSCVAGSYLSNKVCVEDGTFYNAAERSTERCHPNCLSCTNSSFASCIMCRPFRGDQAEMAISGYCECKDGSIDMGNGVCDYQKYANLMKMTESLVSYSSSTMYFMGLASMVTGNYVGLIGMLAYLQSYSTFYFLNSSLVMNINYVLASYRNSNINSFFFANSNLTFDLNNSTRLMMQTAHLNHRLLIQYQNDKSLFLRNQPWQYLIEWALIPAIVMAGIWTASFLMYLYLLFFKSNKVHNYREEVEKLQEQGSQELQQSQVELAKYKAHQYDQQQPTLNKYVIKFYALFHESVAIAAHLIFSSQIVFYGVASFKLLISQQIVISLPWIILSAAYLGYILIYNIRILIGAIRLSKSISREGAHTKKQIEQVRKASNLGILFHLHQPRKNHPLNAAYLPLLLIRNQLIGFLMVMLSYNPIHQIAGCGVVFLLFTLYSLRFCPYHTLIRIFLHFSQLIFIVQVVILALVVETQYGQYYTLQILKEDGSIYKFAWTLLALNYLQMIIYTLIALILVFNLSRKKLCRHSKTSNRVENQRQQKLQQNFSDLKRNNTQDSHESLRIEGPFENEASYKIEIEEQNHSQMNKGKQNDQKKAIRNDDCNNIGHVKENKEQEKELQDIIKKRYRIKNKKKQRDIVKLSQIYDKFEQNREKQQLQNNKADIASLDLNINPSQSQSK